MSTWTKIDGATLSADLKSVEIKAEKLGSFAVKKAGGQPGPTPGSNYLCFTAEENTGIAWVVNGTLTNIPQLQYSIDSTDNWQEYTLGNTISLTAGQKCYWKGTTNTFSESYNNYIKFTSTWKIAASGEVDSLINWGPLTPMCYIYMFKNCETLTQAPELPATTLAKGCYEYMFSSCFYLTEAPELPATTLASDCYYYMFCYCMSLVEAPELPATTLADFCYYNMFQGCMNIKISTTQTGEYQTPYRIPTEGTGIDAEGARDNMFDNTGGTFKGTPAINTTYYGAW